MCEIRKANIDDISAIAGLHAQSWRDNYQEALSSAYLNQDIFTERKHVWHQRLTTPSSNQHVLVAENNGEFCGFICAFGANHTKYGTIIDNLHVHSSAKGKGIGTQLLIAAAKWANRDYQEHSLYLEVLACNQNAIGFYQSLGGKNVDIAYWHTPCGNKVKEYIYRWDNPAMLADVTHC